MTRFVVSDTSVDGRLPLDDTPTFCFVLFCFIFCFFWGGGMRVCVVCHRVPAPANERRPTERERERERHQRDQLTVNFGPPSS